MRNSKAKQLRRTLKAAGVDVNERTYHQINIKSKQYKNIAGVVRNYITSTRILASHSGRKLYQKSKI